MLKDPYSRHHFPPAGIASVIWLYDRFALSFRDVKEKLAARGIIVSYETIRLWCTQFGLGLAAELRRGRKPVGRRWFRGEGFVRMGGVTPDLWRAVDQQRVVVDILASADRNASFEPGSHEEAMEKMESPNRFPLSHSPGDEIHSCMEYGS